MNQMWRYYIEWYTYEKVDSLNQFEEIIIEYLKCICIELDVTVLEIEIKACKIGLGIESSTQLNSYKVLCSIQKKLAKLLGKRLAEEKRMKTMRWAKEYIIITVADAVLKQDFRVSRIIEGLTDTVYYDLEESFISDISNFKAYLSHRKLSVMESEQFIFLIDQDALVQEINLNCFECTKIHKYGCCCGSPCGLSDKNMMHFDKRLLDIEESIKSIDEVRYRKLVESGGLLTANGQIKEFQGHCTLLVQHEGSYKCIAHKYALDHEIPIYDLCPLSCLMYPLEMIELISTNKEKTIILLTSVLEDQFADEFGRWGSYKSLDVELRCINKLAHDDIFREEDYRPVYEVNRNLLIHEFGLDFYRGLEKIFS